MVEEIKISQLTKNYIDNHDVMCEGVHCVFREWTNVYTGRRQSAYIVLNAHIDIRFQTMRELKDHIRNAKRIAKHQRECESK